MKILPSSFQRRDAQSGSAVVTVMVMVAIMVICVSVNLVSLNTLDRELKLLDKKQTQHWQAKSARPATNTSANEIAAPSHDPAK